MLPGCKGRGPGNLEARADGWAVVDSSGSPRNLVAAGTERQLSDTENQVRSFALLCL